MIVAVNSTNNFLSKFYYFSQILLFFYVKFLPTFLLKFLTKAPQIKYRVKYVFGPYKYVNFSF